jgi:hypothetical protein
MRGGGGGASGWRVGALGAAEGSGFVGEGEGRGRGFGVAW